MTVESVFLKHGECIKCGSKNNRAYYTDHSYCFGCQDYEKGTMEDVSENLVSKGSNSNLLPVGDYVDLTKRKINSNTCKKYGYFQTDFKDKKVSVAPYRDKEGKIIGQKIRGPNKDFFVLGSVKGACLFGQHLWSTGSRYIVITEGEIDAMTMAQVFDLKYPVVSIINGASGAAKNIKDNLEYLLGFENIVLMFDADDPGQKAAIECASLFPPGRVKIATLTDYKDPSEYLQAGESSKLIKAFWDAKVYRPDGIINGSELWEQISNPKNNLNSIDYPWEGLNTKTKGLRRGELVTITAGSGVGKTALVREIAYHLLSMGEKVGMIMLEENNRRTVLGLMGIHLNKPIHLEQRPFFELTEEEQNEYNEAFSFISGTDNLFLYNHFGSTEISNLLSRIKYLASGCDCNWIILDHLSIVISGLGAGNERELIDLAMTMLRTLVEETGIGLILVSHLKRPSEGKGHEEGAKTSLSQLRGSHAIAQLSDMVIGAERNQQGENPNQTTVRVLKNRFSGETGEACLLAYDINTGRLSEITDELQFGQDNGAY